MPPIRACPSCPGSAWRSGRPSSARWADPSRAARAHGALACPTGPVPSQAAAKGGGPVSYTHLTLPTICSV
eukprot:1105589-Alexandrium_andersonii.AAC.1